MFCGYCKMSPRISQTDLSCRNTVGVYDSRPSDTVTFDCMSNFLHNFTLSPVMKQTPFLEIKDNLLFLLSRHA